MDPFRAGIIFSVLAILCSSPHGVSGQFLALHHGRSRSVNVETDDEMGMSSVSDNDVEQKQEEDDSMGDEQDDAAVSVEDVGSNVETGEESQDDLEDATVAAVDTEADAESVENLQDDQEDTNSDAVGAEAETESEQMKARDEAAARNEMIASHAHNSSSTKPGCCMDKNGCCLWPFDPEPRKKLCPCPKFRLWIDNEELPLRETKMSPSEIAEAKRQMANAPPAPWAGRKQKSLLGTSRLLDTGSEGDSDSDIGESDSADSDGFTGADRLANMNDEDTTSGARADNADSASEDDTTTDTIDNEESTGTTDDDVNSDQGESTAD